jgi:hypothetical protein
MEMPKKIQILLTSYRQICKGPSIIFIIITSVQRVLFFTTSLSPLKVYKSSERNYDGGIFNEIKHADPRQFEAEQATGPHSELVVSGAMTILHQYMY